MLYNFDEWQQLKYEIKTNNFEFYKIFWDLFEYTSIHDYSYSMPNSVANFIQQFNKFVRFNSSDTYITKTSTNQNNYEQQYI